MPTLATGAHGARPIECLKKYEGKIISLHFKDVDEAKKDAHDVPWGTGVGNDEAQFKELARQKFSGPISIEYESHPENPAPDVAQCVAFFRKVVRELSK